MRLRNLLLLVAALTAVVSFFLRSSLSHAVVLAAIATGLTAIIAKGPQWTDWIGAHLRQRWPRGAKLFWEICLNEPSPELKRRIYWIGGSAVGLCIVLYAFFPKADVWPLVGLTLVLGLLVSYFGLRCCRTDRRKGRVIAATGGFLLSMCVNYLSDATTRSGLAKVPQQLARVEREIGVRKRIDGALLRELDNGLLIVAFDESADASDDARFQAILTLTQPRPGMPGEPPRRIALTPSVKSFVEDMARTASLLDQQRAMVALGDLNAADRLDAEYEARRAQVRADEDYQRAITRGTRFWYDEEYDFCATWFVRAVEISDSDPALLNIAAVAILHRNEESGTRDDLGRAERWLRQALAARRRAVVSDDEGVIATLNNLAMINKLNGDLPEAEILLAEAMELCDKLYDEPKGRAGATLYNLAEVLRSLERFDQSERLHKRALAMREADHHDPHPDVGQSLNQLGIICVTQDRLDEAEAYFERAYEVLTASYGDTTHADIGDTLVNLAHVRTKTVKLHSVESLLLDAERHYEQSVGRDSPKAIDVMNELGMFYVQASRLPEGIAKLQQAVDRGRIALDGADQRMALYLLNLGVARSLSGQGVAAEPLLLESLEIYESTHTDDSREKAAAMREIGKLRTHLNRSVEAERQLSEAAAMYRRVYGGDHIDVADCLAWQAVARYKLGHVGDARQLIDEAAAVLVRLGANGTPLGDQISTIRRQLSGG